ALRFACVVARPIALDRRTPRAAGAATEPGTARALAAFAGGAGVPHRNPVRAPAGNRHADRCPGSPLSALASDLGCGCVRGCHSGAPPLGRAYTRPQTT